MWLDIDICNNDKMFFFCFATFQIDIFIFNDLFQLDPTVVGTKADSVYFFFQKCFHACASSHSKQKFKKQ